MARGHALARVDHHEADVALVEVPASSPCWIRATLRAATPLLRTNVCQLPACQAGWGAAGQPLDLLAITEEIYFLLLSAIPGPSQGWAGAAGSRCLAVGAAVIAAGLGARLRWSI